MANYNEQQAELQLDLEELRYLQSIAKRPRVLSLLSSEIHYINSKLLKLVAQPSIPMEKAPSATTNALKYNTLGSFSWDQDNEKIRGMKTLERSIEGRTSHMPFLHRSSL